MRSLWTLALSLLLSGCGCHAHLLGTTLEAETARPLEGTLVILEGTDAKAVTDDEGWFEVEAECREQPYVVILDAPGYETVRAEVTLDGHELERRFLLKPAE